MKTSILLIASLSLCGFVWADDLDDSYAALKEAQSKKDVDGIQKLAVDTSKLARAESGRAKPEQATDDQWKQRVQFAKEIDAFAEYSLSSLAVGADPAKTIELVDTLIELNPKSPYMSTCTPAYLAALDKQGGAAKRLAGAAKIATGNPNNEDALFTLAEGYIASSPDRAGGYANRLITVMKSKAKPEGVAEADWDRKKSMMLGHGYYVAGATACAKTSWSDCDKTLQAGLPYITKDPGLAGPAYFYLGLSNYQLGKLVNDRARIQQAQKFSEQSAAIPGPMQAQAARNAQAMKQDLAAPVRR